ncbi:glycosyltransferase [Cellvibrio sp.]|uniref:glycosyltransferase n=1 Tax=Cellvibrio sp. TaxID=1965322 RepID=UPI00396484F7
MTKDKPLLLVFASTYPRWIGDPEPAFVHELSRRLAAEYAVHVLCPHAPESKTFEVIDGVSIHRFRYAPKQFETLVQNGGILNNLKKDKWKYLLLPFFFIGMFIKAGSLISKLKPKLIHVHWIIPQGLVLAFLSVFMSLPPMLITSHGGDLFALKGRIFLKIKAWVLSKFSSVTVVSELMKIEVKKLGVTPERIRVIPMGVDFNGKFCPAPSTQRNSNEILFVGRLVEKKGVEFLIKALPLVAESLPLISLTVAGYGPELEKLKRLAIDLHIEKRVNFLGAVKQTELPALYNRCGLFVAPFVEAVSGDQEGFPVSVVEAIACETPIITSRLAVLVDAFGRYAEELTCDVKNIDEFAEKIVRALSNLENSKLSVKSLRQDFINTLDWRQVSYFYNLSLNSIFKNED